MSDRLSIHNRFATGLAVVIGGGFLALVSRIWASGTMEWLGFAGGVLALVAGLAAMGITARGAAERGLDVIVAALGAWTIVLSFASSGTTRLDFVLWEGIAFVVLGTLSLIAHEQTTERVVHELEVTHHQEQRAPAMR